MKKTLEQVLKQKQEERARKAADPVADKARKLEQAAERKRQLKSASSISTNNKRNSR